MHLMKYIIILPADGDGIVCRVMELFPVCADILDTLCMAVLRVCPQELNLHLHIVVTALMPFARQIHTTQGKQVLQK